MNVFRNTVAAIALCGSSLSMAWEPVKPVDFVIMAGKGGGADKMARLMQAIVEKEDLASRPLVPTNKPGGSGAEALVHMKGATDPNHSISFSQHRCASRALAWISWPLHQWAVWQKTRSCYGFTRIRALLILTVSWPKPNHVATSGSWAALARTLKTTSSPIT